MIPNHGPGLISFFVEHEINTMVTAANKILFMALNFVFILK